jgi:hypothetical protein
MSHACRTFFGLTREPFSSELGIDEILQTEAVLAVADRIAYAVRLGAMALITGEVGSGKSTALRFATHRFHPSEYRLLWITAVGGSILELYRQLACELEAESFSYSRAALTRIIRRALTDLVMTKKLKVLLVIDEASLLRLEVLAELCIPSPSSKATPGPSCPSSSPARTTLSTNSTGRPPSPWPPGSWREATSKASNEKTWRPISIITCTSPA